MSSVFDHCNPIVVSDLIAMKKRQIILTQGLPASGKSTWAREQVRKSNGKVKRINKDLLREMLDDSTFSKPNEAFVLFTRDLLVREALRAGAETIIIDDTNFEDKHRERMLEIADNHKIQFGEELDVQYKSFTDVPLDVCLQRDSERDKSVGEKVIKDMHRRYIQPLLVRNVGTNHKGDSVIFDVDGTVAHNAGARGWYEWNKVHLDEPITSIIRIAQMYKAAGYSIIVVSAREGTPECRTLTEQWMEKHEMPFDTFLMRPANDYRRDSIIKTEIYEKYIKGKFDVEIVFDDRSEVTKTWRSLGLRCAQVAEGDF